jgi:hypothetical protein
MAPARDTTDAARWLMDRVAGREPVQRKPLEAGYEDLIEAAGCTRTSQAAEAPAAPGARVQRMKSPGGAMKDEECEHCAAGMPGPCPTCDAPPVLRERDDGAAAVERGAVDPVPRSAGNPLDTGTRAFFESRFQHDFGAVRVHTDAAAGSTARQLHAVAYTVGHDVVFGAGAYQPSTDQGQALLAHELTHVVQQDRGAIPSGAPAVSDVNDPSEREATAVANAHLDAARVGAAPSAALHRQPPPGPGPAPAGAPNAPGATPANAPGATPANAPGAAPANAPGAPVAPKPEGNTLEYGELKLTADRAYLDAVLRGYIAKHGESDTYNYLGRLQLNVGQHPSGIKPRGSQYDTGLTRFVFSPEPMSQADAFKIVDAAWAALEAIHKDNETWLESFRKTAVETALGFLKESEERVRGELLRYGVRDPRLEFARWYSPTPRVTGEMDDSASSRGLGIAAEGLLSRKKKVEDAQAEYDHFANPLDLRQFTSVSRMQEHAIMSHHLSELQGVIVQAQRDLDVFRIQMTARFPILASFAQESDFKKDELGSLAALKTGKNAEATAVIVNELGEKLVNINKVREGLKPGGDVNIWRVPRIVEGTKGVMGALPGTVHARIVDDKVKDEKPSALTGILVGLVQILLVLAAPATEGLSLIPAAAISAGTAYEHFKEYEQQSALHGTDFGPAALSAEEPSLFWLAVDIVGAGFDAAAAAGPALRIFKQLGPAARAIRAGEVSEEAVRNLERAAAEVGGENLAKRVAEDARAIQGNTLKSVGVTAEETRAFEHAAADVAAKELSADVRAAATVAGGEVKVTRTGAIFSCNSPCTMLRERYVELLKREPKWATRIEELEARARALPAGPEGNAARQGIADEAAALEREIRKTVLPGDWTSPLKGSGDYDAAVKRRGSVRPDLDHHPPGWSGREEARFRYGAAGEPPDARYTWVLEDNGQLGLRRLDPNAPRLRFDPASGTFVEALETPVISANLPKELRETRALSDIPAAERAKMEAAFAQRNKLIEERNTLEALGESANADQQKRLKQLYGEINEESRQMGENAATAEMKRRGGTTPLYPTNKPYSTSGDFDQVWKIGDTYYVVEAKGGSGGLGTRAVAGGARAEQGTLEYFKSIAQNMIDNGATKEIRQLGRELLAAQDAGKLKYLLVRSPVGTEAGKAVLSPVQVGEFVLK